MNEEELNQIAKNFIKSSDFFYFDRGDMIYNKLQQIGKNLELLTDVESDIALEDEDYLRLVDIIWGFVIKGYIAPGKNRNNAWFPHAHITQEGKEYRESL